MAEMSKHKTFTNQPTGEYNGISLRFGRLNLILVNDKNTFEAWKSGTQFLKAIKPVTKGFACRLFDMAFQIQKKKGGDITGKGHS